MIHFDHFGWQFDGTLAPALLDVTLTIERGEFVAIAGPSGSGKSTLALAMCGLLVGRSGGQAQGQVHIASHDIATTPLHDIAEIIGLVQQNPESQFATLTVADEIAFGLENCCRPPNEIRQKRKAVMAQLAISHLQDRELATLSGGEQQRVAIASVIASEPAVLVLDEPTASLDPAAARELFKTLATLCRQSDLTVIIIEHKLAHLLPLKPRLICLEQGRMVADLPDATGGGPRPVWLAEPAQASAPAPAAQMGTPLIEAEHLGVQYGDRTILDDISLTIHPGEFVAVLGPNGGGKSTLLQALLGLLPIRHGSIRTCGVNVSPRAVSQLARQVGMVFQNADHQLVADTVWHEALYAIANFKLPTGEAELQTENLLGGVGLLDRRNDHPFRLSWGEKRRLNLLSAIVHQPRLLLLDEPFAGQDWDNVAHLLDVIRAVLSPEGNAKRQPGACLIVTHDPRVVVRLCTRVWFLAAGRVVVDAPVSPAFELLARLGHEAYVPADNVGVSQ
ncbi:MAG: ATP-binding cassette domain-containing protein [Planctomycetota bacterium]